MDAEWQTICTQYRIHRNIHGGVNSIRFLSDNTFLSPQHSQLEFKQAHSVWCREGNKQFISLCDG